MAKSCPTLCNSVDYSPPGSSVHGISQTRILEWVAISFSRGSSQPRDQTHVSWIRRQILYHWATREALSIFFTVILILGISIWCHIKVTWVKRVWKIGCQTNRNRISWGWRPRIFFWVIRHQDGEETSLIKLVTTHPPSLKQPPNIEI